MLYSLCLSDSFDYYKNLFLLMEGLQPTMLAATFGSRYICVPTTDTVIMEALDMVLAMSLVKYDSSWQSSEGRRSLQQLSVEKSWRTSDS